MDGLKLATLNTLQHRLTRDAKGADRLAHRQEAVAGLGVEAGPHLVGEADAPRSARCDLLARDDAIVDEAMNRRRCDAECDGSTLDGQQLAFGSVGLRNEAWNVPVFAQAAYTVAFEAKAARCPAALPIEYADDHRVGVVHSHSTDERDRVLIRAHRGLALARQGQVDLG